MIAHIKKEKVIKTQDLKDHLNHTAELCQIYMNRIKCPSVGYLMGILHDTGKAGSHFQHRMQAIIKGEKDPGKGEGHAAAGAIILNEIAGNCDGTLQKMTVQMICEAIFAHHASLPDNVSPKGEDGYFTRMKCENIEALNEIESYVYSEIITKDEIKNLLQQAYIEVENHFNLMNSCRKNAKDLFFFCGLMQKMLLSALIDADWLDSLLFEKGTEEDFANLLHQEKELCEDRNRLFISLTNIFENNLNTKYNNKESEINFWRNQISQQCKEAGKQSGGIYTLLCPTGAGKTLASMRFSLAHCSIHKKEKIFYIIPYMSIIDQNAKCIKDMLKNGENDEQIEKIVLELHSNAEQRKPISIKTNEDFLIEENIDFFSQRMADPIVLTTMVRFLNTFFADGTGNLRPAHQFQNAVLIFDEIQALPVKQIALFNSLLNYLAYVCNCTCILCTATQPLLGTTQPPVFPIKFVDPAELIMLPKEAYAAFKRVNLEVQLKSEGYNLEKTAEFIISKAKNSDNVLVILNTKQAALSVYRQIVDKIGNEYKIFYLSTKLYAAHRKQIIEKIKNMLKAQEKLIVVSTQLVEAGIDFDFSCVIRSLAGMDSIIQAAGRCNREGKREIRTTYIINPNFEVESLTHLRDIREGARCAHRVLDEYIENPANFDDDLLSEKVIQQYYQYYFWARKNEMTYNISGINEYTLYDLLSDNSSLVTFARNHGNYHNKILSQAFRTAAEKFCVIVDKGNSIFVPREYGKVIWEGIQDSDSFIDLKKYFKEMQQYVVNISDKELKQMGEKEGILFWDEKIKMYVLNEMYYDAETGLTGEISKNIPYYEF